MLARRRTVPAPSFEEDGGDDGASDASAVPDAASLRHKAVRLLARREHSRAELRVRLATGGADAGLVDQVLDELVAERLLSDQRFAEGLARSREGRYGSQRMAHDLRSKGVGEEAGAVLAEFRAGDLDRARAVWARKFRVAPSSPAERARQMRFLQARGFPVPVIRQVVPPIGAAGAEDQA